MAILNNSNAISSGGYDINNSLRFRASASARLSRTFGTTGTNNKIQTLSVWVKRGLLSSSTDYRLMGCYDGSSANSTEINFDNDSLRIEFGGAANNPVITTQVFRDPSAWYHIVIAIDTTQATASNRVKMYVNGTQVTAFSTATYPAQNALSQLTSANANNSIGSGWSGFEYFDGYMADFNFIDGQALTPSSFGETDTTTGSWKPKAYTGTYGTNGFYLKFSDIATTSGSNAGLGKDFSGNANYWTTNNISVTAGTTYDAMIDSPTLTSATVANYAVISPIDVSSVGATISNGNLKFNNGNAGAQSTARATIGVSSGKYYWETTCTTFGSANPDTGILGTNSSLASSDQYVGNYALGYSYGGNGQKRNNNSGSAYGSSYTSGDVIGVALDMDAGTLTFYKNNTSQGTAFSSLSGTFSPAISGYNGVVWDVNFGQRPFSYTPPTGFVRLNTYNLPTPTILQGNKYMDATLYTGNGGTQNVVNAGAFKPDFVWIKDRTTAYPNMLFDSVRGASKRLISNTTDAEATETDTQTSFNSNGFSVSTNLVVNRTSDTFVGWQWQAGQGTTSSNTSGSITSTVSVNTTAGFSVVTYTGTGANATVGHGLGVAPKWIIAKSRSQGTGYNWVVYHASLPATQFLRLNTTDAVATASTVWNNTAPTSTVFSVGTDPVVTGNGQNFVAYCWAEIAGFSKAFSYTGNGSSDGPMVYLGFRPKWILIKNASNGVQGWTIQDTSRSTYNVVDNYLLAQASSAEQTTYAQMDYLSNGFKVRTSDALVNGSGNTIIGMAFAEHPFKNSNAR